MSEVQWCKECHRAIGIGCSCDMTFAEKMRSIQVDKFGLLDQDRKLADPKNRGRERRLK